MNDTFDLDKFKNSWKSQNIKKEISHHEIVEIINKKSRNNVFNILIISVIEFVLGLLSLGYLQYKDNVLEPTNHMFDKFKDIEIFLYLFKIYSIVYVLGFVFFILLFYYSYKKLYVGLSVKEYIKQIIRFRRWANIYIFWNLFLGAVLIFGILGFSLYEAIVIIENSSNITIAPKKLMILIIITFIISALIMLITWGIYRIIYGTFLIRLKKNIYDLEQLES